MDDRVWEIIGSNEPPAVPSASLRSAPSWPRSDLEMLELALIQQPVVCAIPLAGEPRLRMSLAAWTPDRIHSLTCVAGDEQAWAISCYENHQGLRGDANAIGNCLRGGVSSACAGSWVLATALVRFLMGAPEAEIAVHGRAQRDSTSCELRDVENESSLLIFSNTQFELAVPNLNEAIVFPLMPTADTVTNSGGGAQRDTPADTDS